MTPFRRRFLGNLRMRNLSPHPGRLRPGSRRVGMMLSLSDTPPCGSSPSLCGFAGSRVLTPACTPRPGKPAQRRAREACSDVTRSSFELAGCPVRGCSLLVLHEPLRAPDQAVRVSGCGKGGAEPQVLQNGRCRFGVTGPEMPRPQVTMPTGTSVVTRLPRPSRTRCCLAGDESELARSFAALPSCALRLVLDGGCGTPNTSGRVSMRCPADDGGDGSTLPQPSDRPGTATRTAFVPSE